jgi:hypothetical protein
MAHPEGDYMAAVGQDDLLRLRRNKPFQPFRVHATTGEAFDVLDATEIGVGETIVVPPVRSDPNTVFADYGVSLPYEQLVRVEPLPDSVLPPGAR